jgi:pyrroloquinoline quinone biosynthesis protein D
MEDRMSDPVEPRRPMLARHARFRWDSARRQHEIVFPEGVLVLNASGTAIVERCDGRLLEEIVAELTAESDDTRPDEVRAFLRRLAARGLLREADAG